jgi:hypothetical protein
VNKGFFICTEFILLSLPLLPLFNVVRKSN